MDNFNSFEKLEAWQEAHKLVIDIYKITKTFPADEKFRLVDQLCRSTSSTAATLVEGNARGHIKEYLQFAYIAKGSLEESKYHLLLSRDLGYITQDDYVQLINRANQVGKLIIGLIKYLKSNN